MSSVRATNTQPELEVRRRLFSMGFRYRLHRRDLPGVPDLVFPKYHAVVFIHGCFWHYHGCRRSSVPRSRTAWWKQKLEENRRRDSEVVSRLRNLGWRVLIIWECSFRKGGSYRQVELSQVVERAARFLLEPSETLLELPETPVNS